MMESTGVSSAPRAQAHPTWARVCRGVFATTSRVARDGQSGSSTRRMQPDSNRLAMEVVSRKRRSACGSSANAVSLSCLLPNAYSDEGERRFRPRANTDSGHGEHPEQGVPRIRWSVAVDQELGRVGMLVRLNNYGSWAAHFDARFVREIDSPILKGRCIVDLEASARVSSGLMLAIRLSSIHSRSGWTSVPTSSGCPTASSRHRG